MFSPCILLFFLIAALFQDSQEGKTVDNVIVFTNRRHVERQKRGVFRAAAVSLSVTDNLIMASRERRLAVLHMVKSSFSPVWDLCSLDKMMITQMLANALLEVVLRRHRNIVRAL